MVGNTPKHSRFLRTKVQYLQWEIPVFLPLMKVAHSTCG